MKSNQSRDRIFLQSETGTYTYNDLSDFTLRLQTWLSRHWPYFTKPKMALEAKSSDDLFLAMAACWNLGIPFIPLDVAFISRSKINRVDPEVFFGRTQTALTKFDSVHVPSLTYDSIKACLPDKPITEEINDDGIFAFLFTSGSTGRAKLVPCKRRQIKHAASATAELLRPGANGLWLHCLPLNHTGGVSIIPRSLLYHTGIYRADRFDRDVIARLITENNQIEVVSLVPTMLKRLLELETFKPNPGLKAVLLGGGPVLPETLTEAYDRGFPVVTSYGMTETCGAIAAEKYDKAKGLSAGTVLEGNQVRVQDKNGKALTAGKSGYLLLKGPQVFEGYADEENNREAFDKEGWFHTRDFGSADSEGRLVIDPRRTDMIITGGENVSPYEVEAMINRLPGVKESAVTGVPDKEWGQKVIALIAFEMSEFEDIQQITSALKQMLPAHKVPKQVHIVSSLPKTSLGKLQREKIKEMADELGFS